MAWFITSGPCVDAVKSNAPRERGFPSLRHATLRPTQRSLGTLHARTQGTSWLRSRGDLRFHAIRLCRRWSLALQLSVWSRQQLNCVSLPDLSHQVDTQGRFRRSSYQPLCRYDDIVRGGLWERSGLGG